MFPYAAESTADGDNHSAEIQQAATTQKGRQIVDGLDLFKFAFAMAKIAGVDPWHYTGRELILLLTPYEPAPVEYDVSILKMMMPTGN